MILKKLHNDNILTINTLPNGLYRFSTVEGYHSSDLTIDEIAMLAKELMDIAILNTKNQ